MDIRYRQPFVLRAQTWTSNMLGLQLAFAAAVYRQARDHAVSNVDARAVAQSLHTRIPQAVALLVFSGMRVSLSCYSVASLTGAANRDDSAIALSLSLSPSRALATHSKTYLQSDWLKVT